MVCDVSIDNQNREKTPNWVVTNTTKEIFIPITPGTNKKLNDSIDWVATVFWALYWVVIIHHLIWAQQGCERVGLVPSYKWHKYTHRKQIICWRSHHYPTEVVSHPRFIQKLVLFPLPPSEIDKVQWVTQGAMHATASTWLHPSPAGPVTFLPCLSLLIFKREMLMTTPSLIRFSEDIKTKALTAVLFRNNNCHCRLLGRVGRHSSSYIEALIPNVILFGDGAFMR